MMNKVKEITPADIESKFRDVQEHVNETAQDKKKIALAVGIVATAALLAIFFLAGKRSGKKKNALLRISKF